MSPSKKSSKKGITIRFGDRQGNAHVSALLAPQPEPEVRPPVDMTRRWASVVAPVASPVASSVAQPAQVQPLVQSRPNTPVERTWASIVVPVASPVANQPQEVLEQSRPRPQPQQAQVQRQTGGGGRTMPVPQPQPTAPMSRKELLVQRYLALLEELEEYRADYDRTMEDSHWGTTEEDSIFIKMLKLVPELVGAEHPESRPCRTCGAHHYFKCSRFTETQGMSSERILGVRLGFFCDPNTLDEETKQQAAAEGFRQNRVFVHYDRDSLTAHNRDPTVPLKVNGFSCGGFSTPMSDVRIPGVLHYKHHPSAAQMFDLDSFLDDDYEELSGRRERESLKPFFEYLDRDK